MIFSKCTCPGLLLNKSPQVFLKNIFLLWLTSLLRKDGIKRNLLQYSEDLLSTLPQENQLTLETENNFYSLSKLNMDNLLVVTLPFSFQKISLVNTSRIEGPFCFLCLKNRNSPFKSNKFRKQYFCQMLIWYLLGMICLLLWIV